MAGTGPVVMKFGGTSVQDEAALARLVGIVARTEGPRVVVVSAVAGVTNLLVGAIHAAAAGERAGSRLAPAHDEHVALACALVGARLRQAVIDRLTSIFAEAASLLSAGRALDAAERDAVLSAGELASSWLVAAALADAGIDAEWVDARRVIVTDERHGAARPRLAQIRDAAGRDVVPHLESGRVPVMGGYIGSTPLGVPTTLGRGGSDYSAAVVGAALNASRVEIWTDVDGILSADPRLVPEAALLERVSGAEAYDLARFGARVLHAGALEPVSEPRIPVVVRNSRRPAAAGTEIGHQYGGGLDAVVGLAHRPAVSIVDLVSHDLGGSSDFLAMIDACVDHGASHAVTPVAVSPQRALLAVDNEAMALEMCERMRPVADAKPVERGGLVAVVGRGIQSDAAVWRALLELCDRSTVRRVVQSSSGYSLVAVTQPGAAEPVVRELHDRLVGVGSAMQVAS